MDLGSVLKKRCSAIGKRVMICALVMVFTCSSFDVVVLAEVIGEIINRSSNKIVISEEIENQRYLYSSGSGTKEDPYQISTVSDLLCIRYDKNLYYVLTNDIYINQNNNYDIDWSEEREGTGTVGGHIDGKGYTVYGLYNAPLFGDGRGGGLYISNLNLKNVYYDTISNGVGFSNNIELIENCSVQGTIITDEHDQEIGCIGRTIVEAINCTSDVNVNAPNSNVSGIARSLISASYCYNYGSIQGKTANGIANYFFQNDYYIEGDPVIQENIVNNCNNYGSLSGNVINGIVNIIDNFDGTTNTIHLMEIRGCDNYGRINATEEGNGICSKAYAVSWNEQHVNETHIINCNNYGNIITNDKASGLIQEIRTGDGICSINSCNNYGYITSNSNNIKSDYEYIVGGVVSCAETYGIYGVKLYNCINEGDISLSIDADGAGFEILSGIVGKIDLEDKSSNSIIDCINKGSILSESPNNEISGILGQASTNDEREGISLIIDGCCNLGDLTGNASVNGIVGYMSGFWVENYIDYRICNCYNAGTITSYAEGSTGIACGSGVFIENCYNSGNIIGGSVARIASISAQENSQDEIVRTGKISNCYNVGELSGKDALFSGNSSEYNISNTYCLKGMVNLEESGTQYLSSDQMKNAANFIGFDFDTIWKMDEGFYGYPVLRNNEHQTSLPDVTDTELAEGEVRIQVVNEKGQAIQKATVSIASTGLTTDEKGMATFSDITSDMVDIMVEAPGYPTKIETFDVEECNNLCKIVMTKSGLSSAMLLYNGKQYNLVLEEKKISIDDKDTMFTITCKPTENIKNHVTEYKLIQEDEKAGTSSVVMISTAGIFNLKTEQLSQGNKFYVLGYNNEVPAQQLFKTQIHLNVIKPAKKIQKSQMDLGKDLSFTVGDDVPIFGGQKISLDGITALPVYTEINDETIKVGFNINVGKLGTDESTQKRKWQGMKETFKKSITGNGKTFFDNIKAYSDGTYKLGKNPSVSVAIAGYAEGPISGEKLKGKLYVCLSISGSKEAPIPYTPLVAAFDVSGKISGGGETTFYFTTSDFEGNCYIEGAVSVTGSLGIGFAYVASAGVYGKGELSTKYIIVPKDVSGFEYWKLSGEAGVQARFLGKSSAKWRIIDGTYYLYKRDSSTVDRQKAVSSKNMMSVLSNPDLYTTIQHEQVEQQIEETDDENVSSESISQNSIIVQVEAENVLAETGVGASSTWIGSVATSADEIDSVFVDIDAYIDAKPQIVKAGDDIIMMYLVANSYRNAQNASTLVYSIYDERNNQWSAPQIVNDDGTADYNPVVCESESGAYVIWNNSLNAVEDGTDLSLNDTAYNTDLYTMYYDSMTDRFIDGKTVSVNSGNEIYESNATVFKANGIVYYAWSENSNKDVFGLSGTNTIYLTEENNGIFSKKQVATIDRVITDLRLGKVGNEIYLAYSFDRDGDLSDISDMNICIQNISNVTMEPTLLYEGGVSDLQFNVWGNENLLLWYSNGNYYTWNGIEIIKLFEEESLFGSEFSYFADESGTPYISFSENRGLGSNRCLITYNDLTSTWNLPVPIAESTNYIEQMDSVVLDGKVLSVYNVVIADIGKEEWVENSKLGSLLTGDFCDLVVTDVNYLSADFQKGEKFPVTISVINNGTVAIEQMAVKLKDSEGTVVAEVDVTSEIQPGETKEIECELLLPSDVSNSTYTLSIYNSDVIVAERNSADNVTEIALGVTDIQTSAQLYCLNGHYSVAATVTNKGLADSNVIVNIKDYTTDEVYYTTSVEALAAGSAYHLEIPLQYIGISEVQENAFVVETISDDVNEVEGNNIAYISVIPSNIKELTGEGNTGGENTDNSNTGGGNSGNVSGGTTEGNSNSSEVTDSIVKVSKIKLTGISKKIANGKKITLTAKITPSNATNKAVSWKSSNEKYATVNASGVVTTKKAGIGKTVSITATAKDGSGTTATYKIKIMKHKVTSVKLKASKTSVKAGKSVKIKATIKTSGKSVNKTLKWTSSNTKYATVTSKGVVKTKKAGKGKTVTITATSTDGTNKKAKVKLKIK